MTATIIPFPTRPRQDQSAPTATVRTTKPSPAGSVQYLLSPADHRALDCGVWTELYWTCNGRPVTPERLATLDRRGDTHPLLRVARDWLQGREGVVLAAHVPDGFTIDDPWEYGEHRRPRGHVRYPAPARQAR